MRKEISIAIVLFVLIAGATIYYLVNLSTKHGSDQVEDYIPAETALLFRLQNVEDDLENLSATDIIKDIKSSELYNESVYFLQSLDTLTNDLAFQKMSKLYLGIAQVSKLKVAPFALASVHNDLSIDEVEMLLNTKNYKVVQSSVEGYKVLSIAIKDNKSLHLFVNDGVVFVTTQFIILESAVKKLNNSSTFSAFVAHKSSGNENFFINHNKIASVFNQALQPGDYLASKVLNSLEAYAAYKLIINQNQVDIYGSLERTNNDIFGRLKGQEPQTSTLLDIVPEKVAFVQIQAFNSFETWFKSVPLTDENNAKLDSIDQTLQLDLLNDVLPTLSNEWCLAVTQPVADDFASQEVIIAKVNDQETLAQLFINAAKANSDSLLFKEDYAGIQFYKLPNSPLCEILFGSTAKRIREPYFAFYQGYVILGTFLPNIKVLVDDMLIGQSISNSVGFAKMRDDITSKFNYLLYINPDKSLLIPKKYLAQQFESYYAEHTPYFSNFESIVYQLAADGSTFYNHLHFNYNKKKVQETEVLWKQKLDAEVQSGPYLVDNHNDKSKECLFFDKENNLYLVSKAGKRNWKVKCTGKPIGEPQQIDLYKNNKLQYLFASEKKLYLLDRNGHKAGAFPLNLPSKAVVGVASFDFYNDKNYQVFVGTANSSIYGYSISGKPLPGWSPLKIDAPLSMPIQYFKKSGKTYLFGISNKGTLYVWDLDGKQAIEPIEVKANVKNPLRMYFGANLSDCILVSSDTTGQVVKIKLNGEVSKLKMGNWSAKHQLQLEDLNGDKKKDLLFSDSKYAVAYQDNGKKLFSITSTNGDIKEFRIVDLKSNRYFGYYTDKKLISLQKADGSLLDGFPLQGENFVIADFNNDKTFELITYIKGDIIAYNLK